MCLWVSTCQSLYEHVFGCECVSGYEHVSEYGCECVCVSMCVGMSMRERGCGCEHVSGCESVGVCVWV